MYFILKEQNLFMIYTELIIFQLVVSLKDLRTFLLKIGGSVRMCPCKVF